MGGGRGESGLEDGEGKERREGGRNEHVGKHRRPCQPL